MERRSSCRYGKRSARAITACAGALVSDDGHIVQGVLAFAIGLGRAPPVRSPCGRRTRSASAPWSRAGCSSPGLLASGLALFDVLVWRPLGRGGLGTGWIAIGLAAMFVSAHGLVHASHGGSATRFGLTIDVASAIAATGAAAAAIAITDRSAAPFALVLAVALLPVPTVAGHALDAGRSWIEVPIDFLHVLAAAVWIGGLLCPGAGRAAHRRAAGGVRSSGAPLLEARARVGHRPRSDRSGARARCPPFHSSGRRGMARRSSGEDGTLRGARRPRLAVALARPRRSRAAPQHRARRARPRSRRRRRGWRADVAAPGTPLKRCPADCRELNRCAAFAGACRSCSRCWRARQPRRPTVPDGATSSALARPGSEVSCRSPRNPYDDRPLLATVSPNGDGYRDFVDVRFYLTSAANVIVRAQPTQCAFQRVTQPPWGVRGDTWRAAGKPLDGGRPRSGSDDLRASS